MMEAGWSRQSGSDGLSEVDRNVERWVREHTTGDRVEYVTLRCAKCGWSMVTTPDRQARAARDHRARRHPEIEAVPQLC